MRRASNVEPDRRNPSQGCESQGADKKRELRRHSHSISHEVRQFERGSQVDCNVVGRVRTSGSFVVHLGRPPALASVWRHALLGVRVWAVRTCGVTGSSLGSRKASQVQFCEGSARAYSLLVTFGPCRIVPLQCRLIPQLPLRELLGVRCARVVAALLLFFFWQRPCSFSVALVVCLHLCMGVLNMPRMTENDVFFSHHVFLSPAERVLLLSDVGFLARICLDICCLLMHAHETLDSLFLE